MPPNKTDLAPASQADRFRAMAEELECDPDEAAFKAKLAVITKAKVSPSEGSESGPAPGKKPG